MNNYNNIEYIAKKQKNCIIKFFNSADNKNTNSYQKEVYEMVTNVFNNMPYIFNKNSGLNNSEWGNNFENTGSTASGSNKPKIDEKAMMDLRDVQNFLFMMIGTKIKESTEESTGRSKVNYMA